MSKNGRRLSRAATLFPLSDPARTNPRRFGGAGRDRTDDLLLAKQALSQLSYSPLKASYSVDPPNHFRIHQDLEGQKWWAWEDLNFRPHAYQACALTT